MQFLWRYCVFDEECGSCFYFSGKTKKVWRYCFMPDISIFVSQKFSMAKQSCGHYFRENCHMALTHVWQKPIFFGEVFDTKNLFFSKVTFCSHWFVPYYGRTAFDANTTVSPSIITHPFTLATENFVPGNIKKTFVSFNHFLYYHERHRRLNVRKLNMNVREHNSLFCWDHEWGELHLTSFITTSISATELMTQLQARTWEVFTGIRLLLFILSIISPVYVSAFVVAARSGVRCLFMPADPFYCQR